MVRPERFERPTYWFVASCSIQLSYGRTEVAECNCFRIEDSSPHSNLAGRALMLTYGVRLCAVRGHSRLQIRARIICQVQDPARYYPQHQSGCSC